MRRASVMQQQQRPALARAFRLSAPRFDAPAATATASHAKDLTPENLKTTEKLATALSASLQKQGQNTARTATGSDGIRHRTP